MKAVLGLNPWLSIWVHPRRTMRALLGYSLEHRFPLLCAVYGLLYMLHVGQFLALGRSLRLFAILLFAGVLALPVGYLCFTLSSALTFGMGKLIKGKGTFKQIRAATYWSTVPMGVSLFLWLGLIVVHGNGVFVPGYEKMLGGLLVTVDRSVDFALVGLGVWSFIIYLHALGEVQGFSVWMALLNTFLTGLSMVTLCFLMSWGLSALTLS